MRTKLFITCMIMTLLSLISLSSCSSESNEMPETSNVTFDDELFSLLDSDQTEFKQLKSLTITCKITPTVISDSCEFYAMWNEAEPMASKEEDTYTVPLEYTLKDGIYHVSFKVRNVTVLYKSKYYDVFPTDEDSMKYEIEVNKHASNNFSEISGTLTGTPPNQTLGVKFTIDSNEGGTNHTYIIKFLASLHGNKAVIKDSSYAI